MRDKLSGITLGVIAAAMLLGGGVVAAPAGVFTALQAVAAFGGASQATHEQLTCANAGTLIQSSVLYGSEEMIVAIDPAATDEVWIYSKNGEAEGEGIQLCLSGCHAPFIKLPAGNGVFKCAGDAGDVKVNILGIER